MAIEQPLSTNPLNAPDHSLSHRVFANDSAAPVQSVVVASDGKVGIGTTAPGEKLEVAGNLKVGGATGGYYLDVLDAAGTKHFQMITSATNATFAVNDGGTNAVSILHSNGNVGIGTTGPGAKLDINTGTNSVTGLNITDVGGQAVPLTTWTRVDAVPLGDFGRGTDSYGQLTIYGANSSSYAKLQGGGALTIDTGATAKFRLLPYNNDIYFQNTNTSGDIYFTGNSGADLTGNLNFRNTGIVNFGTAGSERMTILANGNVGIGTTAPASKLHILDAKTTALNSGTAWNTVGLRIEDSTAYATGVGGGIVFVGKFATAGTTAQFAGIVGSKESATDGVYPGALRFFTNDGGATGTFPQERMRISSTGNVGIGTTSPTSRIHGVTTLSGATGDEVAYSLNYTTNKATSGNDTGLLINQTDTASPGTSYPLDIKVGGVSKFSVSNTGQGYFAGNVGIGITSPTAYLHIKAGTTAASTAPIKLTAGPAMTVPEIGAIEFDGMDFWITVGVITMLMVDTVTVSENISITIA